MNQARRSNDLQMSQLERSPEGFNALRRLYAVRKGTPPPPGMLLPLSQRVKLANSACCFSSTLVFLHDTSFALEFYAIYMLLCAIIQR